MPVRRRIAHRDARNYTRATHVRFARPDILFYDAHRIDLYQFICALHLIAEDRRKKRTLKPSSRPKFKTDQAGLLSKGPRETRPSSSRPSPTKPYFVAAGEAEATANFSLYFIIFRPRRAIIPGVLLVSPPSAAQITTVYDHSANSPLAHLAECSRAEEFGWATVGAVLILPQAPNGSVRPARYDGVTFQDQRAPAALRPPMRSGRESRRLP
jgi:hypothetical protein